MYRKGPRVVFTQRTGRAAHHDSNGMFSFAPLNAGPVLARSLPIIVQAMEFVFPFVVRACVCACVCALCFLGTLS